MLHSDPRDKSLSYSQTHYRSLYCLDIFTGGSGSDDLQYVQKILLTLNDCQATLYEDYHIQVTETMICAGEKGIDSCQVS